MKEARKNEAGWIAFVPVLAAVAICGGVLSVIDRRRHANEDAAIWAMKTIATAESIFREGEKDGNGALDYGSLAQLSCAQLIDGVLGSGTKHGYIFEARASTSTSEFLWFAVARPVIPGVTGEKYFETNHAAVIFYTTTAAFALNTTDCDIPGCRSRPDK